MADPESISIQELIALLAPTLGLERSQELLRDALDSLELRGNSFSKSDAARALDVLGRMPGMVGTVARFAEARLDRVLVKHSRADLTPSTHSPRHSPETAKSGGLSLADLTALLAPTLGQEKSEAVILEVLRRSGFPLDDFSIEQGIDVMGQLANVPGLVGISARFARARLFILSANRVL